MKTHRIKVKSSRHQKLSQAIITNKVIKNWATLNNVQDYWTKGQYRTPRPNLNPTPLVG